MKGSAAATLLIEALDEFGDLAEAIELLAGTAAPSPDLQRKLPGMVQTLAKRLAEGLRRLAEQLHDQNP